MISSHHISHTHQAPFPLNHTPFKKSSSIPILHNSPVFPAFKKLELSDRSVIEEFVSKFPPYSDFNFVSLWSYNVKEEAEFCFLHDNLVIKFHDYITGEPFYTFLGENNLFKTVELLLQKATDEKISKSLKLVPEFVVHKLNEDIHHFDIHEDNNNHDYMFSVQQHAELKGKIFQDKRQLVNHFRKNYPEHNVKILNIAEVNIRTEIEELFITWEENKNSNKADTEHEFTAIKRMFESAHHFDLQTVGLYVNEKMVAFSVSNVSHSNQAVAHFEKVNTEYKGASAMIRYVVAKHLQTLGIDTINYEQDLGIEGLRKAKQYWNPTHFLKKFIITHST